MSCASDRHVNGKASWRETHEMPNSAELTKVAPKVAPVKPSYSFGTGRWKNYDAQSRLVEARRRDGIMAQQSWIKVEACEQESKVIVSRQQTATIETFLFGSGENKRKFNFCGSCTPS